MKYGFFTRLAWTPEQAEIYRKQKLNERKARKNVQKKIELDLNIDPVPESVVKEIIRDRKERNFITRRRGEYMRRTKLEANGGTFTLGEWETLLARYNWTCPCCHRSDVKLTADHIIPVVKGGSNNIENIQPLCQSCNSKKYTKIIKF